MSEMPALTAMEYLDVVNEKDEVIGRASYQDVYKKLLTHRIVHILIFNSQGKMALQLRSKQKSFCPLHWSTSVGGHVHSGETYEEAALRECQEELGRKVKIKFAYKDLFESQRYEKGLKKILVTFKSADNGPFKPSPREVKVVRFFSLDEIQKMVSRGEKFHPELLFLLRKHFNIQ